MKPKSEIKKAQKAKKSQIKETIKENKEELDNFGLNKKQRGFCKSYVFDWNATRAYQENYPDSSYEAAMSSSCELLRNPKIEEYIEFIQKDLAKLNGISQSKVLQEHMKLAFNSIAHLHNTWIERKEFESLTEDQKACISEISTQTRIRKISEELISVDFVKIKLYDKQKALDSISKMLGYDAAVKLDIPNMPKNLNIIVDTSDTALSLRKLKEEFNKQS